MRYLIAIILVMPAIALAAAPKTWSDLVSSLVSLINSGIVTLVAAGLVLYFYGIASNIINFENNPDKRKAYFFWGIIILFIMFSVWGILALVHNALFSGSVFKFSSGAVSSIVAEVSHQSL